MALTGMWVTFFTNAGIPSDVSATYALTFTENRIQKDMLLDLNKEYLRDMGISRMGDVIAILRHAKLVHENAARDRVLSTTSTKLPVAAVTGCLTATQSKPSSPATRMLERYTRNTAHNEAPQASLGLSTKRKLTEAIETDNTKIKKARLIKTNPTVTANLAQLSKGPPTKQTVFARLGNLSETGQGSTAAPMMITKTIYARLGNKSEVVFNEKPVEIKTNFEINEEPLKYEGILKSPLQSVKKVVINTVDAKQIRKICNTGTMRADEKPLSAKEKLYMTSSKSVKFSNHIDYKVIEPIPEKRVIVQKISAAPLKKIAGPTSIFNKPERRLSIPGATEAPVKARIGFNTNTTDKVTTNQSVFKRLGGVAHSRLG